MSIQKKLKEKFKELVGTLNIQYLNKTVIISGSVSVSNEDEFDKELTKLISEAYPGSFISKDLEVNEFTVVEKVIDTSKKSKQELDEVNILFYGHLETSQITPNDEFKIIHQNNRQKLDNCIKALNFIAPIVLDQDLKVIDGNFRLQLAKENNIKKVLVVVIDDNDKRANFLRLALNRTGEFQRWNYRDVDKYVDGTPQAQPLLEPIGFFGTKVLPVSFFSDTVISYEIDPFSEKQRQYSQETGLAEWAKYRRSQMSAKSAEKRAIKEKPKGAISLFDLVPKEEDFLETYDIDKEMEEFVEESKEVAGRITDHVDAIKKKEIEEKGGVWQNTHRSSKEVAKDKRAEAIEAFTSSDLLTESEKSAVLSDITEYAEYVNDIESLVKKLRGE